MRLSARNWLYVFAAVFIVVLLLPRLWKRIERFETGSDYRIPYDLSKDYWLYERRLGQIHDPAKIFILGDSVVWGEYVLPDGTLSYFLSREAGVPDQFINAGVNGLFPLALEGLTRHYAGSVRGRKVLLQCNLLWMSSPKADLQLEKEETFNHSQLVPQFHPRIPCYKADANVRLGAVAERNVSFVAWVSHLQIAYFEQKSILNWTLVEEEHERFLHPNAYRNPLAQITLVVPSAREDDPTRGPLSVRHKSWSSTGSGATHFEWVDPNTSLQWAACQRLLRLLRDRGNDVFVLLGPFNEHMIAEDNQAAYRELRDGTAAWLEQNQIPHLVPETLPSTLYADASHPLTEGYALLARRLYADESFSKWLKSN